MTIKVNGEKFCSTRVRQIFRDGREEIIKHNITDEKGVIEKSLKAVEKMVQIIGVAAEIDQDVEESYM